MKRKNVVRKTRRRSLVNRKQARGRLSSYRVVREKKLPPATRRVVKTGGPLAPLAFVGLRWHPVVFSISNAPVFEVFLIFVIFILFSSAISNSVSCVPSWPELVNLGRGLGSGRPTRRTIKVLNIHVIQRK